MPHQRNPPERPLTHRGTILDDPNGLDDDIGETEAIRGRLAATGEEDLAGAELPGVGDLEGGGVVGEGLEGHDAGGVVVEEFEGGGAVGEVDGVGLWGGEVEAFEVAAGGWGRRGEGDGEGEGWCGEEGEKEEEEGEEAGGERRLHWCSSGNPSGGKIRGLGEKREICRREGKRVWHVICERYYYHRGIVINQSSSEIPRFETVFSDIGSARKWHRLHNYWIGCVLGRFFSGLEPVEAQDGYKKRREWGNDVVVGRERERGKLEARTRSTIVAESKEYHLWSRSKRYNAKTSGNK